MALPKIEKRIRPNTPLVGKPPYGQVHAHSTGNRQSSLQNEVDYFQTKPMENGTFTHIVGNGRIVQVAPVNRGNWDVGGDWNSWGYAAVELIESHKTKAEFLKDYKIYVELLRKLAKDGGVKIKVDSGELGILTHNYCTYHQPNSKSDHVDPIPYLAKWGISKAQFKKDVESGNVKGSSSKKDWSKNYYTTNPLKIKTKKTVGIYAGGDTEFKKKKTTKPKGTILYIRGIKYAKNGCPRLITTNSNLVSANKKYVKKMKSKDWSKQYYVKIPKKVKTKVTIGVYAGGDTEFEKKLSTRKKGTIITVRGIKHAKNGCPRLITTGNKLITANKKYVEEVK